MSGRQARKARQMVYKLDGYRCRPRKLSDWLRADYPVWTAIFYAPRSLSRRVHRARRKAGQFT